MPNCAAAPKRNIFGFESSGPKSIIAPMPMNSSSGSASLASIADFEEPLNDALTLAHARDHLVHGTPDMRQVHQDRAEAHRQQQARAHSPF